MFSVQYHFPSPSCQALRAMPRSRRKFRHLLLILVKVWSLEITHTHRHVLMANNEQKLMLFSSHTIHLHTKRKGRRIDFSEASYLSVQFSSVAQSCPTRCDPMNHSMPGLPVHSQLPEFTQTHVHRVSDAIQPSHPLSSPSPPAPNPSQHQSLFQ